MVGPPTDTVSRAVAHALRHAPWIYELELDDAGWVLLTDLVEALRAKGPAWHGLSRQDLVTMIETSSKKRYEMAGDRIRALYGHSVPGRLVKAEAVPPDVLYHGTSPQAWSAIRTVGLAPMSRQYVHLSVDRRTAVEVGHRKSRQPVLLTVGAREAAAAGLRFYRGNELTWLADAVPARFLTPSPSSGRVSGGTPSR
jgi:putative RNA 2'-phosphotransferase